MPTYLKDLIELPDQVRQGDFVLRLSEAVERPDETLRDYVVTPQLAHCFDEALGLIKASLDTRSSKGAYLHGSFGSGKSHFMAVLYLLLKGNPQARGVTELSTVVAKHAAWTEGKKFLLVPYHMIGARDMASAVLGGYADRVMQLHPTAPQPGVYRSEEIIQNAENLRRQMGDQAFFDALNRGAGKGVGDGWGNLAQRWDATTYEAAVKAPPKDEKRVRLVGDVVYHLVTAARGASEYVDLDHGLSIISKHAKSLGYDGLILFLDELILWLASHAADVNFVAQEGQKLAKLVEAQNPDRPAPIVSFIARQRDLRELVGSNMMGVEKVSFSDSLRHWDQRFAVIKLEDRNLPTIAEKRVLRPKSESARQQVDTAFRETEKIRAEVMDVLLTSHGNRQMFRQVYPFSPALMETLVALSSLLQRERTALKIMLQLLVDQKNSLKLGDIIPVGDMFDAIVEGEDPFHEVMKVHFQTAKKLYKQKLLPLIEQKHGLRVEEAHSLPPEDGRALAFRADDRLAKTLLLSALAPEVESFKSMTVNRLAALNHGTIRTPIPGREGQIVYGKVQEWASHIGQIKIGEEPNNPTVSVQLTGVDTDAIMQQAASEDNPGNQVRKIKELLFERLGVVLQDELWLRHEFTWRGTKRACDVLLSNVRSLTDESFQAEGDRWKVIIDYPFDHEGRSPKDDLARLETFSRANEKGARTLVWLPSFFSRDAQKDLGKLVILDHILTGERFDTYASRLSAVERGQARGILEGQQSALKQKLIGYLEIAYGIATGAAGALDTTHDLDPVEHFQSLDLALSLQPPVGANLQQAFLHLLDQALTSQYPAHPKFENDVRLGMAALKRVYGELEKALQTQDGRVLVEPALRKEVREVVVPLKVAAMGETHIVIDHHWKTQFVRKEAEHGGAITVGKLRKWMDEPSPMGLPAELQNLIIMFFATQNSYSFFLHGGPFQPALDDLPDELELKQQPLPSKTDWDTAAKRVGSIFGLAPSPLLNATNVAKLIADIRAKVNEHLEPCRQLARELETRVKTFGILAAESKRLNTAQKTLALVEALRSSTDSRLISTLLVAEIASSENAMSVSLTKSADLVRALTEAHWDLFAAVAKLADDRKPAGEAIVTGVKEVLVHDELSIPLRPKLRDLESQTVALLSQPVIRPSVPPGKQVPPQQTTPGPITVPVVAARNWVGSDEAQVRAFYQGDEEGVRRNRALVQQLKKLYERSQVQGDSLPADVPKEKCIEVLEAHQIRPLSAKSDDVRANMIVVTPTLHALIHSDPKCSISLADKTMILFSVKLNVKVDPNHNGA